MGLYRALKCCFYRSFFTFACNYPRYEKIFDRRPDGFNPTDQRTGAKEKH